MVFLFFILGAIFASFAGVIVARLYTGQSLVRGRSLCDYCGGVLEPSSLVPIVSYVFSQGRALCCGVRLSLYSPLTELLLGVLFALAYVKVGFTPGLPFLLGALTLLLVLVLYDFAHQILPPVLLVLFIASSAIAGYLFAPSSTDYLETLVVAFLIALFFFFIYLFSRGRAIGFADVPLAFGLALLVGPATFSGFLFSFWIGAIIGIIILARRPRGSRMGVEVPFAPYLAAGFLLAYFTQWNIFTLIAALP